MLKACHKYAQSYNEPVETKRRGPWVTVLIGVTAVILAIISKTNEKSTQLRPGIFISVKRNCVVTTFNNNIKRCLKPFHVKNLFSPFWKGEYCVMYEKIQNSL